MGHKHSKTNHGAGHDGDGAAAGGGAAVTPSGEEEQNGNHSNNSPDSSVTPRQALPLSPQAQQMSPSHVSPIIFGFPKVSNGIEYQIIDSHVAAVVHNSFPPGINSRLHPDAWYLLYHSKIHGSSFSRLVQLCCDRGPTVIVIRDGTSGRVFGGYNETSWTTVAQREKDFKSRSASMARAKREGVASPAQARPSNQSSQFFGTDRSFIFRAVCPDIPDVSPSTKTGTAAVIYPARTDVNSNFMYLFDTHPDEEKEGIGMGGAPPAQFGWFIDRWLEKGVCRGTRCSTYRNPMLSTSEEWHVDAVEVYAVGLDTVEALKDVEAHPDGKTDVDRGESIRKGADRRVDKIILEMNEHHFYADDVDPEVDDEEDVPPSRSPGRNK